MTEGEQTVRNEYRQLQEKRAYFLLAAAGTTIGFIVSQMDGTPINWSFYVMLFSLVMLGLSFAAGIIFIQKEEQLLYANFVFLELAKDQPSIEHTRYLRTVADKASFNPIGDKKRRWGNLQLYSLFVGGLSVPAWKVAACANCMQMLLP